MYSGLRMISVRIKSFLINLLIASILAGSIFTGFFFRKQILNFILSGKNRLFQLGRKEPEIKASNPEPGVFIFEKKGSQEFNLFGNVIEVNDSSLKIETGESTHSLEIGNEVEIYKFEDGQFIKQEGSITQFVKPGKKTAVLGNKRGKRMIITGVVFAENDFSNLEGREFILGPKSGG